MFGKLKEIREYEGYTQKEVAQMLNVKRSTYAGWECGKDIIPLRKLYEFAHIFHLSLDYIMGESPNIPIEKDAKEIDLQTVAKNLKEFRLKEQISQKEFAKSIHTSQTSIHKYENGKSLITTTYALEFSKQYKYSLDKLVGRKKNN